MSSRIVQPVGKIKLTNVAVIRYECKGKRFEIACYKNKIVNWRNGIEKDIDEVLQIPNIFLNASKGVTACHEDLMKCFGTIETATISKIILEKGTEQVSGKERDHQLQTMSIEVATLISEMCYNPDTDSPYTMGMIQRAMKDSHISIKPTQTVKKQVLETIQILKKNMRIERKQMLIKITCKTDNEAELVEFSEKEDGIHVIDRICSDSSVVWNCVIDSRIYKSVDMLCQKNPSITCDILQHKYVYSDKIHDNGISAETANEVTIISSSAPEAVYLSKKFKCSSCEVGFDTASDHRGHFKSEWHRFNLKRKNRSLPIISEVEFNGLDDVDRELFLKQDSIAT